MKTDESDPLLDQTVDEVASASDAANAPHLRDKQRRCGMIVEGSQPKLTAEIHALLQRRLRAASVVLCAGFSAFLVRRLFHLDQLQTPLDWMLFIEHALMTVLSGLIAQRLCVNCSQALRRLRAVELLLFGGSALFFLGVSYSHLTAPAESGYLRSITPLWMLLIYTYALFIPNTVRRAAIVIGAMAATPVALTVVLLFVSSDYAAVLRVNEDFDGYILRTAMLLSLCAASAVWGAATIGTLRREAFEARQLGQYRLTRQLGQGGMGEVFLAEHLLLKRPCAIKLIRPDKAGDGRALARFELEVRSTAKLTHWNTVEIYDYGRAEDGTFYYAMEYLPGLNLRELVQMHGPLPAERVIHLLCQVCEALSEAHQQNFLHRDIKPANIFAAHRGGIYDVVKLLDFGLARSMSDITDAKLTTDGAITGSPMFMSPEQAAGDALDGRSDLYSLGAVAYYLLTADPPFVSENPVKLLVAHATQPPASLSDHRVGVPADLESVVMRCLQKSPSDRYATAEDLRQALEDCQAAGTWTREMAKSWWIHYGCPQKKALDAAVLEDLAAC